jgi:hypothetical protein
MPPRRTGVVDGIAQRRDIGVGALPDDERDAVALRCGDGAAAGAPAAALPAGA